MNISNNRIDFFQKTVDNILGAVHLPSFAIPGSTNAKIYQTCRMHCGGDSPVTYTEIAKAIDLKKRVDKKGEWHLFRNGYGSLVSTNGNGVFLKLRNRGSELEKDGTKTVYQGLWIQNNNQVQFFRETVKQFPAMLTRPDTEKESSYKIKESDGNILIDYKVYNTTHESISFDIPNPEDSLDHEYDISFSEHNLANYLSKEHGDVALSEMMPKFLKMFYAVEGAHKKETAHGKIEYRNFIEDKKGNIRLKNSKFVEQKKDAENKAEEISTDYKAPEIKDAKEEAKYSVASDIYALGKTFGLLLSKVPSEDKSTENYKDLEALVENMTAADPAARKSMGKIFSLILFIKNSVKNPKK